MFNFKKALDNAFSVMGMVFIGCILFSLLTNNESILTNNRLYFLFFFIILLVGKYWIFSTKN